jgi:hypothetical protein
MRLGIFGMLMLLLTATVTVAEENKISGNFILPACKQYVEYVNNTTVRVPDFSNGVCLGLVTGVFSMAIYVKEWCKHDLHSCGNARVMCMNEPEGVTLIQAILVVIKYIEDRPNRLHEGFEGLVLEALTHAWPCH